MKKFVCLTLLLGFVSLAFAQGTEKSAEPEKISALQSMVDTELAFAKMAADQGIRAAFVAFIADDGVLFRPTPVKGKQWFNEHPLPPSEKRPLLTWYPIVAEISQAQDMGYTTGPWEFKADIHDDQAAGWGNFLTVWKRQPDRSWKYVIDLGISNPQPDVAPTPWQAPKSDVKKMAGYGLIRDGKADIKALLTLEREFSAASGKLGPQKAFEEYVASGVRLYRNGRPPITGKANALAALTSDAGWTWEPLFADVSSSNDLGYSYGTYQLTKSDAPEKVESGNYYRIWKRQGSKWQVVTDLLDPVAPKKN
jgi:ketosteroid isomerase-like protein